MIALLENGPVWRRAIVASIATVTASAAFVGLLMLAVSSVVDMSIPTTTPPTELDSRGASADADPVSPPSQGKSKASKHSVPDPA